MICNQLVDGLTVWIFDTAPPNLSGTSGVFIDDSTSSTSQDESELYSDCPLQPVGWPVHSCETGNDESDQFTTPGCSVWTHSNYPIRWKSLQSIKASPCTVWYDHGADLALLTLGCQYSNKCSLPLDNGTSWCKTELQPWSCAPYDLTGMGMHGVTGETAG